MPRVMEITTPLGDDLLFRSMHAREEMSRLSEFQIDLLSPKNNIKLDDILGKNVTVKLALPEARTRGSGACGCSDRGCGASSRWATLRLESPPR